MANIVLKGACVFLLINGSKIGRVIGFAWSSSTPRVAIRGIDSVIAYELAPTTASCQGSISLLRTIGDGGAEGLGISTPQELLSKQKYFNLMLIDAISDNIVFQADQCSLVSQSWNAAPKGLLTGTINFEALTWNNEITAANSREPR